MKSVTLKRLTRCLILRKLCGRKLMLNFTMSLSPCFILASNHSCHTWISLELRNYTLTRHYMYGVCHKLMNIINLNNIDGSTFAYIYIYIYIYILSTFIFFFMNSMSLYLLSQVIPSNNRRRVITQHLLHALISAQK